MVPKAVEPQGNPPGGSRHHHCTHPSLLPPTRSRQAPQVDQSRPSSRQQWSPWLLFPPCVDFTVIRLLNTKGAQPIEIHRHWFIRPEKIVTGCQIWTIGVGDYIWWASVLSKLVQWSMVVQAIWGRVLLWGIDTPLVSILLLQFWTAHFSVTQYASAFIVIPVGMKSINNTPV